MDLLKPVDDDGSALMKKKKRKSFRFEFNQNPKWV
jgi:hypothetical protein